MQAPADLLYLSASDAHGPVIQFPGVLARAAQCKCTGGKDSSRVSEEGEACRA